MASRPPRARARCAAPRCSASAASSPRAIHRPPAEPGGRSIPGAGEVPVSASSEPSYRRTRRHRGRAGLPTRRGAGLVAEPVWSPEGARPRRRTTHVADRHVAVPWAVRTVMVRRTAPRADTGRLVECPGSRPHPRGPLSPRPAPTPGTGGSPARANADRPDRLVRGTRRRRLTQRRMPVAMRASRSGANAAPPTSPRTQPGGACAGRSSRSS